MDPAVVQARARPARNAENGFDLERLARLATIAVAADGREHLVLSNGFQRLRLDIVAGSLRARPVVLEYRLSGVADIAPALTTLWRLRRLCRYGAFPPPASRQSAAQARLALALRVHDGLRSGASHRAIAEVLFGVERVAAEWDAQSDSLKSRTRRLARRATMLARGGYRALLG